MWILILGAPGTGKNAAADHLAKQGFDLIQRRTSTEDAPFLSFFSHLRISTDKLRDQINASSQKERSNVVTIGSYWDSHEVFSHVLRDMEILSQREKKILDTFYSAYREPYSLIAPHAVIWTKATQMNAMNRMKLRGSGDFNPDLYMKQSAAFEKFMEKVRVPVIEVESSEDPVHIQQSIEFGINSLKATALTSGSVWGKDMFYV